MIIDSTNGNVIYKVTAQEFLVQSLSPRQFASCLAKERLNGFQASGSSEA